MKDEDYHDYHCQGKIFSHFKKFSDSCLTKSKWICLAIFILPIVSLIIHNQSFDDCDSSSFNNRTCEGNCSSSESNWEEIEQEHCDTKTNIWITIGWSISLFVLLLSLCIAVLLQQVLKSRVTVGISNEVDRNKVSASDYW